ncbi:high-affinity choline transporter 1-like [Lytechinus pictus]|uniref:high-affinity choline transporter 1-like n=1 Tax=Lytechinus pictus TaxID=7653 RepID=UPI00240E17E8|nr:high-affinity choline transporter 1-like [Lytechinus pictus]
MAVNWVGIAGIVVFYLLILAIGLWASKKSKGDSDPDSVLVASRDMNLFVGVLTTAATIVGGAYINGAAESVFAYGLVWTQAPWAYALCISLGGILFAKNMRAKGYLTMLDPFQEKYGNRMGGLLFIPALFGEILWSAAILSALGTTMSVILDLNVTLSVIISAVIVAFYTFFGGLYSVAYTDVVQLFCIFIGLWFCVPFVMTYEHAAPITSTSKGWIGTIKPSDAGVWIDFTMLMLLGGITWQAYFQRVLAARSPEKAQKMSYIAGFVVLLMAVPSVLIGAVGYSTDWNSTALDLNKTNPYEEPALILPLVIQYLTPTYVAFVGLGALSAAVMSSADSSVLAASSMFAHNIWGGLFRAKVSKRELVWVIRISIVMTTVLATIIALTVHSVYYLYVLCSDLVYVIIFPQLVCVLYVKFSNTYGSLAGFILGFIFRVGGGEETLHIPAFIKFPFYSETDGQRFPFRTFTVATSFAVIIVVSYVTDIVFRRGHLGPRWDVFKCVTNVEPLPDEVKYEGENDELQMKSERSGKEQVEEVDEIKKPLTRKDESEYVAGDTRI